MKKFAIISALFSVFSASTLWAESMTIDGTIKNQSGVPVPGVEVEFANAGVKDTTDSEGKWSVVVDASNVSESRIQPHIALENGILQGVSAQAKDLDVRLLNASGQQVWSYNQNTAAGENWSLNLGNQTQGLSTQNYFLAVQYGSHQYFYRVDATFSGQYVSPRSQSSALTYVECIIYRKQGQIITEDYVEYYKSIIDKYLYERNVEGFVLADTLKRTKVDEVYAVFTGGKIKGEVRAKMGWSTSRNSYSGKIYIVKPLEEYDFQAITQAFDSNGRLIAQSPEFLFTSGYGDITMESFMAGNAFPYGTPSFSKDTVSEHDTFYLFGNGGDDFGGPELLKWEYKWNNSDWTIATADSVEVVSRSYSNRDNNISYEVRYMDKDSNVWETGKLYYQGLIKDIPNGNVWWTTTWLQNLNNGVPDTLRYDPVVQQGETVQFMLRVDQVGEGIDSVHWLIENGDTIVDTMVNNSLGLSVTPNADFFGKYNIKLKFWDEDGNKNTNETYGFLLVGKNKTYCPYMKKSSANQSICTVSRGDAVLTQMPMSEGNILSALEKVNTIIRYYGDNSGHIFETIEAQTIDTLYRADFVDTNRSVNLEKSRTTLELSDFSSKDFFVYWAISDP